MVSSKACSILDKLSLCANKQINFFIKFGNAINCALMYATFFHTTSLYNIKATLLENKLIKCVKHLETS